MNIFRTPAKKGTGFDPRCRQQCVGVLKRGDVKPFPYLSDVTIGRVHIDVGLIDQSTSLPSGLKQMLLIYQAHN